MIAAAWRESPGRLSALVVVAIAILATATGLGNEFAYDDIPMIVENPVVQHLHSPWHYLTDSYWGPNRSNSLYRPVTVMALALERWVGAGSAFPFHLANVLLHAGLALAVLVLARELMSGAAALVAAATFAAHPLHSEAVANVVGQSEMLVGIPLVLALVLYVRDRRRGALRGRTIAGIVALWVMALLSKEHAVVLPGLFVAAELAFRRQFASGADARRSLWILLRACVLVLLSYFVVRLAVLGAVLGDTPHPALEALSAGERRWVMLGLVPEIARLLLWPARLYADYSPQAVPFLTTPQAGHLPGALIVLAYLALLAVAWRRDRTGAATFALLWFPVTFSVISNVVFASGVVIAERTLLLPSVTVSLLVGRALELAMPLLAARGTPVIRASLALGAAGIVAIATAHSAGRQPVWADNATLFATTVVDAPDNFRAHHSLGEMFGSAASWDRAEMHLRIADSLFPGYDLIELSIARVLHFDDRCGEAIGFYDSVLYRRPDAVVARIGRAACRLEVRQLSASRADAIDGIARGEAVGVFGTLLQKAESSLVANDTVDARNRWWRAGMPVSKSEARLRIPVLFMKPSTARARRMPESSP